jgi:ribosomal protein S12 methylthiotransferase accessory factor
MIEIRFPGGVQVEAVFEGFSVLTDQPVSAGGAGKAPSPFDLFLASVAACSGFYALRFCQERGLSTEGLRVSMDTERDEVHKRTARLSVAVTLPEGFPEKYRAALLRSVSQCTVKRHLEEPPAFELTVLAPSLELAGAIA